MSQDFDWLRDELRAIRDTQTTNHLEVCQRLASVENEIRTLAPLEIRVRKLEGWRNKMAGALVAGNLLFAGVFGWVRYHFPAK